MNDFVTAGCWCSRGIVYILLREEMCTKKQSVLLLFGFIVFEEELLSFRRYKFSECRSS